MRPRVGRALVALSPVAVATAAVWEFAGPAAGAGGPEGAVVCEAMSWPDVRV